MTAKSEFEAAYFTWLRAQEERDHLLRYREYLEKEAERLESFATVTRELAEPLSRKVRRPIDHTERPLLEAVGQRRNVVRDELGRMDDRVQAAHAFVEECEAEVTSLRR